MKFVVLSLLFPLSFLPLAFADQPTLHTESSCTYKDQNNEITADFIYDLEENGALVSSKLIVNDTEIPSQKEHCLENNVPGRRGYRCTHRSQNGDTYDIYPQYEAQGGTLTKASMIIWGETDAVTINFSSCE